jgi:murein DD-endopeptidase MepM/ murein hydrolase activator NlpD
VLRSRKLLLVFASAGALTSALGAIAWLPSASAQQCVLYVTLLNGQKFSFTVDVPPGTPVASIALPTGAPTGPVSSVTESCMSPTTGTGTTTTTTTTTTAAGTTTTTTTTATGTTSAPTTATTTTIAPPTGVGGGKAQHPSTNPHAKTVTTPTPTGKPESKSKSSSKRPPASKTTKPATPLRTSTGVPTPTNPTFSFSLPGPAPIGVPNFFIDSFRIPPFLLPIYQAAGIQYDVPWQVLAGINEIETDYGRNLSISSAGAVGWMQFLPATWKQYGVDANGDGVKDPYNPVDAIFGAANYLHAAGASKNLGNAILAYNHAGWYVQSVLLRAKLIGGMPDQLIGALTGLVSGHFPVAAPAKYADDHVEQLATRRVKGGNASVLISSDPNSKGVSIYAKQGSPVIAVNDGKIVKIGSSANLGNFIELQDSTGNIYTYANLGSISTSYPVPKPVTVTPAQVAKELSQSAAPTPSAPATAGQQGTGAAQQATAAGVAAAAKPSKGGPVKPLSILPQTPLPVAAAAPVATPLVKERLFAHPSRPASYAAGGIKQMQNQAPQISSFENYFSGVLHLAKNQYTLNPMKAGAIVVAGTILGRLGGPTKAQASHVLFMIQPAGKGAPQIDPKPILDGWKLLEATAVYRASGKDPFFGPGAKNPTVGQVLLMSKAQLQQRILADPHVQIYACGRRDIAAGLIDRRVLATIEFLVGSGLDPSVSSLQCGNTITGAGTSAAGATGSAVQISGINGVPIQGHQGSGSITDITIRRLLTLQGAMKPNQIISGMSYKGQANTLALPDHQNRLEVDYTPLFGQNKKLSAQVASILKPDQWLKLINRIGQIPEPVVPIAPSSYAIK